MPPHEDPTSMSRPVSETHGEFYCLWEMSRIRPCRGEPRIVGQVWRLHHRGYLAACVLWNVPSGFELRLTVDADAVADGSAEGNQSAPGRDFATLMDTALGWKQQLQARGWA